MPGAPPVVDRSWTVAGYARAMSERVTSRQLYATAGVDAWRVFPEGAHAFFGTSSFGEAVRLVDAIARRAPDAGHPADIDIRADGVTVFLRAGLIGGFSRPGSGCTRGRCCRSDPRR